MNKPIIAALVAAGAAAPVLAATGVAPDPSSWMMLALGAVMVGLTASGRHRRTSRVAE